MSVPLPAIDEYVARVQEGDAEAFRGVVDAALGSVRAFVVSRSLPGLDVDEIVQRAFVEAYKNIGDYTLGTNFVAWVVTIARYQLLMETSRMRRQADYHSRYVPHALASVVEDQIRQSPGDESDLRMDFLKACLDQLPEPAREILQSRYEDDGSIGDIAAREGRSAGAVRKQLCLLRKQLHDCVLRKLGRSPETGPSAAGGIA